MKRKKVTAFLCLLSVILVLNSCGQDADIADTVKDPIDTALRSVVAVSASFLEDGLEYATANGSAIVYKTDDSGGIYLLTNYHVIYDDVKERTADLISLSPYGGSASDDVTARLVSFSPSYDVALLYSDTLEGVFPAAVAVGQQRIAELGERVYAVGNALGRQISVTSGVVSAQREKVSIYASYKDGSITLPLIRTDCALNQGNSGGGLFGEDGAFLGLVSARQVADKEQGMGYALPASVVMAIGEGLMSGEALYLFNFGAELLDKLVRTEWTENGLVCSYDVTVDSTVAGSVASALFEKGDVLVSVAVNGDTPIHLTDSHQLHDIFLKIKEGDSLWFKYRRAASEETETSFTVSSYYMIKD